MNVASRYFWYPYGEGRGGGGCWINLTEPNQIPRYRIPYNRNSRYGNWIYTGKKKKGEVVKKKLDVTNGTCCVGLCRVCMSKNFHFGLWGSITSSSFPRLLLTYLGHDR